MDLKKNDICVVTITDVNSDGDGVGKLEGFTVFVKDTVIGDVAEIRLVKLKKNYGFGRLEKLLTPSKKRVEARCPVARQCGGCQMQFYSYEEQLKFKENKVKNNLERIGKIESYRMHPIIGMKEPFRYRNKAQFPVGKNKEGRLVAGFYAGHTHSIIEQEDCVLGGECNAEILKLVLNFMEKNGVAPYDEEQHKGIVRHVLIRQAYHTGEIMVCMVINGRKLPKAELLVEALTKLEHMTSITVNTNTEKTNVILGKELSTLWGKPYITDYIGDISFQISPLSFFQVNPIQTQHLYDKALEYANLTGTEVVWDMYCGIGTISLFLARKAKKVYGVEVVPQAIENARENAVRNGITNAEFFVGKAEEVVPEWYADQQEQVDVVVVDPPRKGCDEVLLRTMVEMLPKRIVYVSCDSATLARDLGILEQNGYQVQDVTPVDMFPQTVSVETVVLLSQQHVGHHIEVDLDLDELRECKAAEVSGGERKGD